MANFVVSRLPEKIHTGLSFFEACLEEKVIVVPGESPGPDVSTVLTLQCRTLLRHQPQEPPRSESLSLPSLYPVKSQIYLL